VMTPRQIAPRSTGGAASRCAATARGAFFDNRPSLRTERAADGRRRSPTPRCRGNERCA
jgi:hypothetical protein